MIYWLVLPLSAVLLWCLHTWLCESGRLFAKIPGPKDYPVIGNAHVVVLPPDKLFNFLRSLYKTYGGIVKLYGLNQRTVNIYEPDDVEKILSSVKFTNKTIPYKFFKPWLADGVFTSNGDKWHDRRKMLTPAFHFNILKKYFQIFTEHTEALLMILEREVGKERTDFLPLIAKTTLNIIAESSMGISMSNGKDIGMKSYVDAVHIACECMVLRFCRIWFHIDTLFKLSEIGRKQKKALKVLHSFTNQVIRERKTYLENNNITEFIDHKNYEVYGKKGRVCMLDMLIQNEKDKKIDFDGVREEVDTFIFGGHHTTATALHFMIIRLAHEPEAQEKIYRELLTIFGDSKRMPTMEDLQQMVYLKYCILELLRIYPVAPFISRHISEDVILSGYRVPAGAVVNMHIYDIHHRADLYPDPEKFIPERFLPENCLNRHPYAYIPFSAGPRNCIGQKYGMLQLKTILSALLRRFKVEPVTKLEEMIYSTELVLRTKDPVYVRFCKR